MNLWLTGVAQRVAYSHPLLLLRRFSAPSTGASSFYELSALDINKKPVDFSSLKGKTVRWIELVEPTCPRSSHALPHSPSPALFVRQVLVSNVASK